MRRREMALPSLVAERHQAPVATVSRWFALLPGATMGIDDIRAHNQENIRATLANLAAAAEQSR